MVIQEPGRDAEGNPTQTTLAVYLADHAVYNVGRLPASDVSVTFNFKPQHVRIYPAQHFETATAQDGRVTYQFKALPPQSSIEFMLLSVGLDNPSMTSVISKEAASRKTEVYFQERHSKLKLSTVLALMWIGFATVTYVAILGVMALYRSFT
jgi:hypothetical protein